MQLYAQTIQDLVPVTAGLPNFVFFHEIHGFIDDELIHEYLPNLGQRVMRVLGGIGVLVLTLWIMVQGFRIVTGQSRESMMALVVNALRATFIVGVALGIGAAFGPIYGAVTDGLSRTINETMTGDADPEGAYANVDRSLAILQAALVVVDSVDGTYDEETRGQKERSMAMITAGLGLPAITAAAAIMLNKFAIGLVLALGPVFILCLLFDQTKALFHRWLLYGIGAIFSMAVLTVTVTLALDMVIAVGTAFWISNILGFGSDGESVTSMAMQQGGLGLILTTLIVSAPPVAAMLFQGTLGQFSPYNAFQPQPAPGSPGNPGGTMAMRGGA
ncbi:type IV secretion system protein VirB6 [Luteimonas sp. J16]|uniref:type IV secretion system protein n=1 Tax=unclassified Luteimonas TaxID=2629088 RepID=UPI0004ADAE0A|nr:MULTISPECIES: type IV secretion system protein [unclassified Luteimonas]TWG94327.1 type IV secretion system protein VirB6 [Luteimonas sp. J16]